MSIYRPKGKVAINRLINRRKNQKTLLGILKPFQNERIIISDMKGFF